MGERLSLVAGPRVALVSPFDFSPPLRNLHVGKHLGREWWPGVRTVMLCRVAGDVTRQGLHLLQSDAARDRERGDLERSNHRDRQTNCHVASTRTGVVFSEAQS